MGALFMGSMLYAQNVFDYPLSVRNSENFYNICRDLSGRSLTKGAFVQTRTIRNQSRPLVSTGDFIVVSELGMVWITKTPAPSITTLGRDYMIQSVPGGTGTRIDARGNEIYINMADTISSLFTGNVHRLTSGFDIFFMEDTAFGKTWSLGLVPKERTFRNYAERIVLEGYYAENAAVIRSIIIYERSGNSLSYLFNDQSFPDVLEPNEQAYFSAP